MAAGQQDRVRPCLLEAARGDSYWRVDKSIEFLVMLGDRGAVAELAELAARPIDGNPGARRTAHYLARLRAVYALAELGDPAAVGLARRYLLQDPDWGMRREAVREILGRDGGPEAREGLKEALKDKKEEVRRAAWVALGLDGIASVSPTVNLMPRHARMAGAQTPAGTVRLARGLLKEKHWSMRLTAVVDFLAPDGGPEAREGLKEALQDKHEDVRLAARVALDRLNGVAPPAARWPSWALPRKARRPAEDPGR